MLAEQLLREAKLQPALDELQQAVRSSPSDPKLRIFLAQLLMVLGQWERALRQLQLTATLSPEAIPMANTYRDLIVCEAARGQVFQGTRAPHVIGDPPEWLAMLVHALGLSARGEHAWAAEQRAQALEMAEAVPGLVNGHAFAWLADGDARLGPVLEVIVRGHYHWVPLARVAMLQLSAPADLRDFVWTPAALTLVGAEPVPCFIPTRYPDTEQSADDMLRLARKTEWLEVVPDCVTGLGQRCFITDEQTWALLDVRTLELRDDASTHAQPSPHG